MGEPFETQVFGIEGGVSRTLTCTYDDANGLYTRTDQDGLLWELGRIHSVASDYRESRLPIGPSPATLLAVAIFSDPSSSWGPARGRGCFLLKWTGH